MTHESSSKTPPTDQSPLVSIVIVTYNATEWVKLCLDTIRERTDDVPYEIIIVDNASQEDTRELLRQQDDIRLFLNEDNLLWSAGCNQGMQAAHADSKYFLLLNSDIEVLRPDWLTIMVDAMETPTKDGPVAMVGTRHHYKPVAPVWGWLDGQCLLLRRELMEDVGYMDAESYPWGGGPRLLIAQALKRGWTYKFIHRDDCIVEHHRGRSRAERKSKKLPTVGGLGYAHFTERARLETKAVNPLITWLQTWKPLWGWRDHGKYYYCPPVGPPQDPAHPVADA